MEKEYIGAIVAIIGLIQIEKQEYLVVVSEAEEVAVVNDR